MMTSLADFTPAFPARDEASDEPFAALLGWALILVSACFVALVLILGRGALLTFAFPLVGLGVGGFLFATNPPLYLGYAWWLWLLTPEIRRIADFQGGWNAVNPLMLTPLLVSGLAVFTLLRRTAGLQQRALFGFLLILIALFYGTLVGVVTTGAAVAVYSLLTWLTPVLLAFHLAARWEDYPKNRAVVMAVFGWGAFVMGAYGVVQYFVAPPWDGSWIVNSGMINQGRPEPQGIRVFSTLNSSGPFAFVISAGILMLAADRRWTRLPLTAFGIASLLLSLVRAAWLGLALGFIYLMMRVRTRTRLRLIIFSVGVAAVVGVTLLSGPLGSIITKRLDTFSDLDNDTSFIQRKEFYLDFLSRSIGNIVGDGIGSTSYVTKQANFGEIASGFYGDSGLLQIPFVLGWFGGFLYLGGVVLILRRFLRGHAPPHDVFVHAAKAIVIMIGAEMVFENTLINVTGACIWTFIGMGLAAQRYWANAFVVVPAPEEYLPPPQTIDALSLSL